MHISKRIALGSAAALGFILASSPAAAQATRTWISGVGDDVNPCSRTAPCKTFAGAISKTATGGEINCLDPGGFGAVTITKSISLLCDDVENGVLVSGGNGIVISNATASVTLSGFDLEGFGNGGSSSSNGVYVINAASVEIRNSRIHAFKGYGIYIAPTASSPRILIDNVTVTDNGTSGSPSTGGIAIAPASGFSVTGSITNTTSYNNLNVGLRLDTTGTTGTTIAIKLDNSRVDSNAAVGMLVKAPASTGTIQLMVNGSSISNNGTFGMFANGSGVTTRVGTTAITGNATGVSLANGAIVNSYGTNQLDGNTADGAFTLPNIPQK